MNRVILKYPYPITAVILLIFAWVVAQRLARGVDAIIPLAVAAVVVWPLGTFVFVYSLAADHGRRVQAGDCQSRVRRRPDPHQHAVRRAGATLRVRIARQPHGGRNGRLVYIGGWLDAQAGPRVLHVPEMNGTVLQPAIHRPDQRRQLRLCRQADHRDGRRRLPPVRAEVDRERADGMTRIEVPHRSALVIGRVFAADDDDRRAAYALATQIQLTPLDSQP